MQDDARKRRPIKRNRDAFEPENTDYPATAVDPPPHIGS